MLDLSYVEDVAAAVDMNLVMNAKGEFIEVQGTGRGSLLTASKQLAAMLALGKTGIRELLRLQTGLSNSIPRQVIRRIRQQPALVPFCRRIVLPNWSGSA